MAHDLRGSRGCTFLFHNITKQYSDGRVVFSKQGHQYYDKHHYEQKAQVVSVGESQARFLQEDAHPTAHFGPPSRPHISAAKVVYLSLIHI